MCPLLLIVRIRVILVASKPRSNIKLFVVSESLELTQHIYQTNLLALGLLVFDQH